MELTTQTVQAMTRERARRRWSLRHAAEKAGISVGVWQRIEAGENVERSSLVSVAQSFGWDVEDVEAWQRGEDHRPVTTLRVGPVYGSAPDQMEHLQRTVTKLANQVRRLEERVNDMEVEAELIAARLGDPRGIELGPDEGRFDAPAEQDDT